MKTADQRGIAHLLLVVLIVAVLAVAGFAGWRVYQSNKDKNNTAKQSGTADTTPQASETPKSTTPEGFVEYENQELKFSFAYPEAWGDVSFGSDTAAKTGELYTLSFSKNSAVSAELMTKDYETATPSDRFSPAFTDYKTRLAQVKDANRERLKGNDAYATNVLKDHTTNVMYADFDCIGSGYYMATMRAFADGAPTTGIGFWFQDETAIPTACDGSGTAEVIDYVDKTVRTQLDQVMATVKEL
jgi:hypothetical protein